MSGKSHRVSLLPAELAELVFEWPVRRGPGLALPICIIAAALIQLGVVLLFSIRYPAPSPPPPGASPVFFLPRDSEIARNLEPWLEANDPAVFSPIRAARESVPDLPPLAYRPSYLDPPPPLHPLPPENIPPVEPPLFPPGGLERCVRGAGQSGDQAAGLSRAEDRREGPRAEWMDGLKGRLTGSEPEPPLPPVVPGTLRPLVLEAGFDAEGKALHGVVLESSGDEKADVGMRDWLLSVRLAPAATNSWGRVRVRWSAAPVPDPPRP